MTSLSVYIDPGCPWTWITSRWLVDAAGRADVPLTWRSFSLVMLNEGREIPESLVPLVTASARAHRVIASLADEGRHAEVDAFYTAYGTRRFVLAETPDDDMVATSGAEVGIDDAVARAGDETLDALVRTSFDEIVALVGTDVGAPAIRLDGTDRALFGPIVNPAPTGEDADRLFGAFLTLLELPGFYELKRSRTGPPEFT